MNSFNPAGRKTLGAVYTPEPITRIILDEAIPDLENRAFCDPSCGDGAFLVPLAQRICQKIQDCRKTGQPTEGYLETLQNLTGFDIDDQALDTCYRRLDEATAPFKIIPPIWQVSHLDILNQSSWQKYRNSFDAVVGNPPYIRVQRLEKARRALIQTGNWQCKTGAYDLYLLFFEMGLDLLKPEGRLAYITPSSWLRSHAGKSFRDYIRNHHHITKVYDFGMQQVFPDVTTYTAISVLGRDKPKPNKRIPVWQCTEIAKGIPRWKQGRYLFLSEDTWNPLSADERTRFASVPTRLADIADIHVGIQTLADSVFVFEEGTLDIEIEATQPICKVSRMKAGRDPIARRIVYPYENGKLLAEEVFASRWPKAYAYLASHRKTLLARDKGKTDPVRWYAYGREIAITTGFGKKILTSSMNSKPNFMQCNNPESLFYSGYCIKPFQGVDSAELLACLNSPRMEEFIRLTSRPFQKGWFSYAKSYIGNFPVPEFGHIAP